MDGNYYYFFNLIFFSWLSIVKCVLNVSTNEFQICFFTGVMRICLFLFFAVFLVIVVGFFFFLMAFKSKSLLLNLYWHLCGYAYRIEKIDRQRACQILKQKISFSKWRNSQYSKLTWVNKTKCRQSSTLTGVRGIVIK